MQIMLTKVRDGSLIAADNEGFQYLKKIQAGTTVRANIIQFRNAKFFRKWFKLLDVGFGIQCEFGDRLTHEGHEIRPQKEKFREDITILAGYFEHVYSMVDQKITIKARSVAWDSMTEEDFAKLYSATIDVMLQKVIKGANMTDEQKYAWAKHILEFD